MRKIHCLKITSEHFQAVCEGTKKAELRINDRNYHCGDYLLLCEFKSEFTSDVILVEVTHILPVSDLINSDSDWVVLSISTTPHAYAIEILAAKLRELS
ncbi:DUF3850 domain-containing protein [Type-D symbiont of Plautia stali]|uniref:DUF3850 domain-containing protein n=1 Tax=Type-D symbiont of Plautia stali TaxID=1560356 RepID=UPI00073F7A19|nr:DUF3850 domain-containing protein [Type-D symbiont of Plautia stali]